MTPTARTLLALRKAGWTADPVERWLPRVGLRRDWGHFGDVLACNPRDRTILLVQCTSAGNLAARLAKARRQPELAAWLRAGGRFEVHGWQQRAGRWRLRRVEVRGEDLAAVELDRRPPRRGRRPVQRNLFD